MLVGCGQALACLASLTALPPGSGVAMAGSNALAGRLCDWTARRGWGTIGCFLGASAAASVSMLALLAFCAWGTLGAEEPAHR